MRTLALGPLGEKVLGLTLDLKPPSALHVIDDVPELGHAGEGLLNHVEVA